MVAALFLGRVEQNHASESWNYPSFSAQEKKKLLQLQEDLRGKPLLTPTEGHINSRQFDPVMGHTQMLDKNDNKRTARPSLSVGPPAPAFRPSVSLV